MQNRNCISGNFENCTNDDMQRHITCNISCPSTSKSGSSVDMTWVQLFFHTRHFFDISNISFNLLIDSNTNGLPSGSTSTKTTVSYNATKTADSKATLKTSHKELLTSMTFKGTAFSFVHTNKVIILK